MKQLEKLVYEVSTYYTSHGRAHLPWRNLPDNKAGMKNPYRILVSELMLQQTQVARVIPKYKAFLKHFPTPHSLANAPLADVLRAWQGLGYNRRAKYLQLAVRAVTDGGAEFPQTVRELEQLPGVGPYTARAVAVFAYNSPEVLVETNVRTVFTHFCFPKKEKVADRELLPLIAQALEQSGMQPRDFYAALMDYGSYLKEQGIRINYKSTQYSKQKKFAGSTRQLRGAVIRQLLNSPKTLPQLSKLLDRSTGDIRTIVLALQNEKLIVLKGRYYDISPDQ